MATLTIGFNTEYYGIDTFDVFVSLCEPISWIQVSNDITYQDFPLTIDLGDYGISQVNCFRYYVSGNTGCYYTTQVDATVSTLCPSPTPTVTSSITPTPSFTPPVQPTGIPPTPSVTPTITPTSSPSCVEYSLSTPGSPNTTNTVWNFTRCDGQQVIGLSVAPATSTAMCIIPGTLTLVSGPGQSVQLGNCSI